MEPIIGSLMLFAGNFAPVGWTACEGQLLNISEYDVLYSLLGTTYGGDGMSTFAVPDLRGRVPNHRGQAPGMSQYNFGQVSGAPNVTLTPANTPPHSHALEATVKLGCNTEVVEDSDSPVGCYPRKTPGVNTYANAADSQMGASTFSGNLNPAGNSAPIPMYMPTIAMKYCIAYSGIYPSQP